MVHWTQKNSRIQRNSNHRVRTRKLLSRTPESLELKMPFSHRAGLQRTALESIHSTKSLEPRSRDSRLTERKVRVSTPDARASQHVISKFNFFKPVWRSRTVYNITEFYWAKCHLVFFVGTWPSEPRLATRLDETPDPCQWIDGTAIDACAEPIIIRLCAY